MSENAFLWSVTASDNDDADPAVPWPENMLPGAVNNAARSTMAGIARLLADLNGTIATTGSANAYLATSNSGHTTHTNGILITVRANFTNTSAATLNLNSFGAKNIRVIGTAGEVAVAAGQIQSGGTYQFRYDTAANSAAGGFILLNPSLEGASVGDIKVWTTDTQPTGWLWANGAAVSRTTYANLFAVISTTYGTGDGSTTFNVPDLCGRAPFGSDDMGGITLKSRITNAGSGIVGTTLGTSGGAQSVVLDATMIPAHTHSGTTSTESADHSHSGTTSTESANHTHSGTTGGVSAHHTHNVPSGFGALHASVGDVSAPNVSYVDNRITTNPTGNESADHTHDVTTGTQSANHTHTITTGGISQTHTHTFTTGNGTGGGLLHNNMPPALIVNYVIKI